jgi:RNA polymerase sigma factor (sigma-70 family)
VPVIANNLAIYGLADELDEMSGPEEPWLAPEEPHDPAPSAADRERFRILYEANYSRLVGYALRRTSDREEAADLVAETFLVAWRNRDRVPNGDEARYWLYAAARRVLANRRRAQERRERLPERLSYELDVTPRYPSDGDLPIIASAFARLSPDDRNILGLVGWEGLRMAEIARVLDCSVGAARLRTFRARRRLAHELELLGYRDSSDGPATPGTTEEG